MKDLLIKPDLTEAAVQAALAETIQQLPDVAKYGETISEGIENVYMVSCGGGLHIGNGIQWWCDAIFGAEAKVHYRTYDAADFLSLPMIDRAGPATLVMLTSKSGSTAEVLAVGARLEQAYGCKVVCFTGSKQSEIVKYGIKSFYTGDTPQSFHAMLMLHHAFMGGFWAKREGWGYLDKLLSSLAALPTALARAALASQARGKEFARNYDLFRWSGITYFIASGPMQFVGKAYGNCLMEEMLELNVNVFPANHFFHSLVEKQPVRATDRVVLLLGLDNARWQVERLQTWYADHKIAVDVYDARHYEMSGIDKVIQPMLAPIIVEAAFKPSAEWLSKMTKDLDVRKYMGREEFWKDSDVVTQYPDVLKSN